jgi:hypothetical protein
MAPEVPLRHDRKSAQLPFFPIQNLSARMDAVID